MRMDARQLRLALLISLLLHAALVLTLYSRPIATRQAAPAEPISVDLVRMPRQSRGQIVVTSLVSPTTQAAKDAALGQQTQTVDRQTRAHLTARFQEGRSGGAAAPGSRAPLQLGQLGVKMNLAPMGNVGPGALPSTSDDLPGVRDGAQTLLNTREYLYFSFYQRVRRQLERFWEPRLRERLSKMRKQGRSLASEREHFTRLIVVLNPDGDITNILVLETSGLLELDQAALDAFKLAGPFPNPPRALIEADGTVKVTWKFVVKT